MEPNIAAIIILLVIFASVALIVMLPERTARSSHKPTLKQFGNAADADVLAVKKLGEGDNGVIVMSVTLLVYPANDSPYEIHTDAKIWRVDVPHLQPGRKIPVWIDPANRENVAVDLETA